MTAERLQSALGFTAADLESNRAGRLSDSQQKFMDVQSKRGKRFNLGMVAVFIVFIVIIVAVVIPKVNSNSSSSSSSGSSSAVPPWIFVVVIAVVALIMLRAFIKTSRGMGNIRSSAVLSVEGPAHTKAVVRGNVTDDIMLVPMAVYRVKVGKVNFPLDAKKHGGFDEGVNYRCYYVKGTLPVLISAEEI
jgi:predicted nucleic acid-binding Zn ribbon protein